MVFYYEDCSTRFDDITEDLINFLELELEPASIAPEFIANKRYGDYYTEEQAQDIALLTKEVSTKETWIHLAHYFGENHVGYTEAKPETGIISERHYLNMEATQK